jgi:rRNA maturation endonuclease Nob1
MKNNKNLKIAYKFKRKCSLCKKMYGTDYPTDNKICPKCRRSIFKKSRK